MLVSNGEHIGELQYAKITNDNVIHKISYLYFSKDTNMKGSVNAAGGFEYKIEAKKGWNKVYHKINYNDGSAYVTTNLSEVPDGLAWIVSEN